MQKDNLIWAYLIHLSYNMWVRPRGRGHAVLPLPALPALRRCALERASAAPARRRREHVRDRRRRWCAVPIASRDLRQGYCREHIAPERLKGFVHAPWRPTL